MRRICGRLLAIFLAGSVPLVADTSATVTEAVNHVTHGSAQSSATSPASSGTRLQDGEYLKTGVKSRAALELANQSITRLGSNTIFNYSVSSNEIDLQAGTVLFSKPKDGKELTIKTAAVTAGIVGTTGFAQVRDHVTLFGLIEGDATLKVGAHGYKLTAGEILRLAPGSAPQIFFYNIPLFLKTSPLIIDYHGRLPNQAYIDKEVAAYDDFAARGFIQPPTQPYYLSGVEGSVPIVPIPAVDSAGNALHQFNTPPPYYRPLAPPPPPPPPPPFQSNGT